MSAPIVAVVYHSGFGHTAVVAKSVIQGVTDAGGQALDLQIESAGQDFTAILEQASTADAIIFGAPTYMGDVSAALKAFFEASGKIWYGRGWHDKLAGGFTNSFNVAGDKAHSLNSIFTLAMQHGMIWLGPGLPASSAGHETPQLGDDHVNRFSYSIGVAAQSNNAPADVTPGTGDREFARQLGLRITALAAKLNG